MSFQNCVTNEKKIQNIPEKNNENDEVWVVYAEKINAKRIKGNKMLVPFVIALSSILN